MKLKEPTIKSRKALMSGFSLAEAAVGTAVVGIVFVSLYVAISAGFGVIRLARENLRATQIMVDQMEGLRLYTWSQLHDTNFLRRTFTRNYDPIGAASGSGGVVYSGRITVTTNFLSPATTYSANLARVNIELSWTSGNLSRKRELQTYVARHGMQHFVYGK